MALSNSQRNAMALDGFGRNKNIKADYPLTPGDPRPDVRLSPKNTKSIDNTRVTAESISGDFLQNYDQMGTSVIDPGLIEQSKLPTTMPLGQGYQGGKPFGAVNTLQAPADYMATVGINSHPSMMDKPQSAMGLTGQPAMQPDPMAMVPGSTKTTIPKKGKSNKGKA